MSENRVYCTVLVLSAKGSVKPWKLEGERTWAIVSKRFE